MADPHATVAHTLPALRLVIDDLAGVASHQNAALAAELLGDVERGLMRVWWEAYREGIAAAERVQTIRDIQARLAEAMDAQTRAEQELDTVLEGWIQRLALTTGGLL